MKKAIIGQSDFKNIRIANAYYVDKSLFIEEILDCPYQVILIPRPRRFGKTINLSLLYHFFEKRDPDESTFFDGLAIKQTSVFQKHFSKYPVISLTFKDIKNESFDASIIKIARLIHVVLQQHNYLLNWEHLSPVASQLFNKIINQKATIEDYEDSIQILSKELEKYHNKQVIILIDEYDTPIHAAYINNFYNKMIGFMRNLLSGAFKDNSCLFKGVITGTLRVSKESIFTGLNNLGVFTLLEENFNKCFGFTRDEVQHILSDFGLSNHYENVLKWYDGYNFSDTTILNPWSVMNFVSSRKKVFKPFWLNTSSMEMVEEVLTPYNKMLREELNDLIEGKVITKTIYDNIAFGDIKDSKSDLIWSFLLHSGYLNVLKEVEYSLRRKCQLQIPNLEVRIIYIELVEKWIKNHIDLRQLEALLSSLKNGNITLFEKKLKATCLEIMSYHDFGDSPEKVYHALVLGMLVWLSNDYEIRSNRESGYGRYDIIFKPKDIDKKGIIIEFKLIDQDENSDEVLNSALKQIDHKKYDTELKAAGVNDILKIAVGFRGKSVYLKKGSES
jgi:hypothetical protein